MYVDKIFLIFIQKAKGNRIAKTNLKRKNKVGGISLPDIQGYYIAIVVNTLWCWWRDRHRSEEQNRELGNKFTRFCPTDFFILNVQKKFSRGKITFSTNSDGII